MKWLIEKLESFATKMQNLGGTINVFFQDVTWVFMIVPDKALDVIEWKEVYRKLGYKTC